VTSHRLVRHLLEQRAVPVIVDLKKWRTESYAEWSELESTTDRMDYLFAHFAPEGFSVRMMDALPADVDRIVFVDGLNEVLSRTAQEIISTCESYVRYAIGTGVIVADRLVRRELADGKRWRFATVLPLPDSEIERQLFASGNRGLYEHATAATMSLLSTPYFLNAALESGDASSSSAQYFERHSGLKNADALDKAAKAAYDAYKKSGSRTFEYAAFVDDAGLPIANELCAAGVLITGGGLAWFDHHLSHDYLASRYIAARPELWSHDQFDIVTFRASSFEVLALALQQLRDTPLADRFVRSIYDWNIYGAAYTLTEGRHDEVATFVSSEMELAIVTMLAIRRWELIEATRVKAEDALSLFPSGPAKQFLAAASIGEVYRIVASFQSAEPWFESWKALLTTQSFAEISESDIASIEDEDSMHGWTLANVLRGADLRDPLQAQLRAILKRSEKLAVRWRVVHVLGAYPTDENADALLERFTTEPPNWVRYGAIRALVEIAALGTTTLRDHVFQELERYITRILEDDRTAREFEDAIFIDKARAPENWVLALTHLIEGLYEREQSLDKRERLQQIAYQFKGTYR
jgi:hypothetical protein